MDVCPTVEFTNKVDDKCWPLDEPDKHFEQEFPFLENNPRWLDEIFGNQLPTMELAQLFPHEVPEIFLDPINMAVAVGECLYPTNSYQLSCAIECYLAFSPCGNYSQVIWYSLTLGLGRLLE